MTPEQFAYWLQGYAELNPNNPPDAEQWKSIVEHLSTVFNKVTLPLDVSPHIPSPPFNPTNPNPWYNIEPCDVRITC